MERASWITQVGAIESNESLKAEKVFWLWSERGMITAEGQRDTMSLALKGKGDQEPRGVASGSEKRQGNKCSPNPLERNSSADTLTLAYFDPIWTSELQNCKIINFTVLSHKVCGDLLQS